MKMLKGIAAVALLCAGCTVSYWAGRNVEHSCHEKDYQAACILNDCCRNMIDNIGVDAEEIYYEYVDNLDCYKEIIVTREDMERYCWSY